MVEASEPPPQTASTTVFKKRGNKIKSTLRKRPATPPLERDSASDLSEDEIDGKRIKRRRAAGLNAVQSGRRGLDTDTVEATKFAADKSKSIQKAADATRQSNWYDEGPQEALDAKQLLGKARVTDDQDPHSKSDSYRGVANYQKFIQKNPNAPGRQVGPVKAPTNIRTITVTDYAPDVCKDYKQTGFCGFGDSCKFLHAREDYKQGWQLDRDWEIGQKGKKPGASNESSEHRSVAPGAGNQGDEDAMLEKIPFACILCRKSYQNPIITKCNHYFCEKCALERYRKNPACAACGASTGGVFNGAKNLQRLLDKKRERARPEDETRGGEAEVDDGAGR